MAKTPLSLRKETTPQAAEPEDAHPVEQFSQKKKQEPGRYWLQVDRQTKSSYETFEAAKANGLLIKKQFSLLQVAVYDKQESTNTVLETHDDSSVSDPA